MGDVMSVPVMPPPGAGPAGEPGVGLLGPEVMPPVSVSLRAMPVLPGAIDDPLARLDMDPDVEREPDAGAMAPDEAEAGAIALSLGAMVDGAMVDDEASDGVASVMPAVSAAVVSVAVVSVFLPQAARVRATAQTVPRMTADFMVNSL
ncbi:hypothetical protein BH10PSE2_BH10PSE2_01830 [soil metagenome]